MAEHRYLYTMALNIKNADVERLANEEARLAHVTKTEAIRCKGLRDYLGQNVWPLMPAGELGRVMGRDEEDRILGYGQEGF